jgi:hypothetical protein
MLARLAAMPVLFSLPQQRVQTAARSFVEEYFAYVPKAWRTRLPLHYAGAALDVAASLFRRQEPDWPGKVAAMVEKGREALAGRVW